MPPLPGLVVLVLLRCKSSLSLMQSFPFLSAAKFHSKSLTFSLRSSLLLLEAEACRRCLAFWCLCSCTALQACKHPGIWQAQHCMALLTNGSSR